MKTITIQHEGAKAEISAGAAASLATLTQPHSPAKTVIVKVRQHGGIGYNARAGEGKLATSASSTSDALTAAQRAAAKYFLRENYQGEYKLPKMRVVMGAKLGSSVTYYEMALAEEDAS